MLNLAVTEEILRNRLRENVRTRRNAASLTLKKASERAEMHWRHWQKIEAGQVNLTVQTLVRIAGVLGVDPADLLHDPPSWADHGNGASASANGASANGVSANGVSANGASGNGA